MNIHTLWIKREHDFGPELICAWDEFSVNNYKRWREDCAKALASLEGDLAAHRYITLSVSEKEIDTAFNEPTIAAQVEPA